MKSGLNKLPNWDAIASLGSRWINIFFPPRQVISLPVSLIFLKLLFCVWESQSLGGGGGGF